MAVIEQIQPEGTTVVDRKAFGAALAKAREENGFTQISLADRLAKYGVTSQFIGGLERGEVAFRVQSAWERAQAIAVFLRVPVPTLEVDKGQVEPTKPQLPMVMPPAAPAPASPIDLETAVITTAAGALEQISSRAARERILVYLNDRFVSDKGEQG